MSLILFDTFYILKTDVFIHDSIWVFRSANYFPCHFKFDFHRLRMADSLLIEEVTSPRKREVLTIYRRPLPAARAFNRG
jgi:hypothetical protein